MSEEERAALHRSQIAARRQARCENFASLAGNRERREALDRAWAPPLLARLEAQAGCLPDELDSLEDMYCRVPDQNIYVSGVPEGLLI